MKTVARKTIFWWAKHVVSCPGWNTAASLPGPGKRLANALGVPDDGQGDREVEWFLAQIHQLIRFQIVFPKWFQFSLGILQKIFTFFIDSLVAAFPSSMQPHGEGLVHSILAGGPNVLSLSWRHSPFDNVLANWHFPWHFLVYRSGCFDYYSKSLAFFPECCIFLDFDCSSKLSHSEGNFLRIIWCEDQSMLPRPLGTQMEEPQKRLDPVWKLELKIFQWNDTFHVWRYVSCMLSWLPGVWMFWHFAWAQTW